MNAVEAAFQILAGIAALYAAWRLQNLHARVETLEMIVWTLIPKDDEEEE